MRTAYVFSKALPSDLDSEYRSRLIGILTELKPGGEPGQHGDYQFEYKLGGKFQEWFLQINGFPDPNGVYTNTPAVRYFVADFLPPSDFIFMDSMLKSRGLTQYDEWELISETGTDTIKISKTLPENIIKYQEI